MFRSVIILTGQWHHCFTFLGSSAVYDHMWSDKARDFNTKKHRAVEQKLWFTLSVTRGVMVAPTQPKRHRESDICAKKVPRNKKERFSDAPRSMRDGDVLAGSH